MKQLIRAFLLWLPLIFQGQNIGQQTADFLQDPALEGALTGIRIEPVRDEKAIIFINDRLLMVPASTMKTLTVFQALSEYGPEFRWHTDLSICGTLKRAHLYGDIIITASGDPTFGSPRFDEDYRLLLDTIVMKIREADIRAVQGSLIIEQSGNPYPVAGSWPIEDIGTYYGTGVWPLNFNDNTMLVFMRQNPQPGEQVEPVKTEPVIHKLQLKSYVVSGQPGTGDEAYLYGEPTRYYRTLIGAIEPGDSLFAVKAGIPNPPLTFLNLLQKKLAAQNIKVTEKPFVSTGKQNCRYKRLLWRKYSPTLYEVAKKTLNYSVNHYSEALMRLLINRNKPAFGYMNKDRINAYFRRHGFQLIDLEDGSGLAPDNLIAPVEFTSYFKRLIRLNGMDYFKDIMPHAGEEGYAAYFLQGSSWQKQVWVKSGSVSKTQNYVGLFKGKSGKYYVFAIMVNHFKSTHRQVKKAIENYLEKIIPLL